MAGNQAVVQFLIEYAEKGGNLPEKVKRDLDRMGQASTQAGTLTDRLGQAFSNLERREPTMVMRRARLALEELGASAIGAQGPLGRLAVSFASLGTGGGVGLVAIAGLAGIGFEIKTLVGLSDALEKSMTKATDAIASFGGQAATQRIQVQHFQEDIEKLSQPGYWEGVLGRAFPGSGLAEAVGQGRATRLAAAQTGQGLLERTLDQEHQQAIQRQLDRERQEQKRAAEEREREFRRLHPEAAAQERAAREFLAERMQIQSDLRNAVLGVVPRFRVVGGVKSPNRLPQGLEGAIDLSIPPPVPETMRTGMPLQAFGEAGAEFPGVNLGTGGEKNTEVILAAIAGLAGSVRGGTGGMVAGLGGLASTLGGLKDKSGNLLFAGLGPLGTALSFGGSLLSLFSNGQAKVSISRLEQEALEQMRSVQQVPQYLSQNIVTNDLRGAKNRLARLEQLDTVTRGVT